MEYACVDFQLKRIQLLGAVDLTSLFLQLFIQSRAYLM